MDIKLWDYRVHHYTRVYDAGLLVDPGNVGRGRGIFGDGSWGTVTCVKIEKMIETEK